MENRNKKLVILIECALFVAVALVLDFITIMEMPNGGSVKFVMIPLIIIALRRGAKWGSLSSMVYVVLAMILGRENFIYPGTTAAVIIVASLFDYIIAYGTIGLASLFAKPFKSKMIGFGCATFAVCMIRYASHFISGATIWADVTAGFKGIVWFSLAYNGTYMIPITIVSVVVIMILSKTAPRIFTPETI